MWLKHPASVVIDSATHLLMISSPDIDNIAMSLYNITRSTLVLPTALAMGTLRCSHVRVGTLTFSFGFTFSQGWGFFFRLKLQDKESKQAEHSIV